MTSRHTLFPTSAASSVKSLHVGARISHVIFDLDGTLIDTESLYEDVFRRVCGLFGKEYSMDVRLQHVGTPEADTARIITRLLAIPAPPEEFLRLAHLELEGRLAACALMPGVERLVGHLWAHHVPMAVATSNARDAMNTKFTNYPELKAKFQHIVCGASDPDVKQGKPAPDIFLVAAARFADRPAPEQVLVFEDSVQGVAAAVAAGMSVVAVPDPHVPHHLLSGATLLLESLAVFRPELFGLPGY